jgi:N-acyl-D-amino-acid deacylase
LIALCQVAANYGGIYISHLRSEGNQFLQALDELITISRDAKISAEIYHLKAAGQSNWAQARRGDSEDRSGAREWTAHHR